MSRHAGRVGEKKPYWDHRECRWVAYQATREEILVPAQPLPTEPADADDAPVVDSAR